MHVLYANFDTTILLQGIASYPYYLCVFRQPNCVDYSDVVANEDDCTDGVVTFNVSYPMGVYEVDIYGQSDYSNLSTQMATFIRTEPIRVYNPEKICWASGVLTDEFNYPLDDENEENLYD